MNEVKLPNCASQLREFSARNAWACDRPRNMHLGMPGAVNIPLEQIEARLDDLSRGVPLVLVCQSGKRARMVARLSEPFGKNVMILNGGTSGRRRGGRFARSIAESLSSPPSVAGNGGIPILAGADRQARMLAVEGTRGARTLASIVRARGGRSTDFQRSPIARARSGFARVEGFVERSSPGIASRLPIRL
jgi:hypothetical protein